MKDMKDATLHNLQKTELCKHLCCTPIRFVNSNEQYMSTLTFWGLWGLLLHPDVWFNWRHDLRQNLQDCYGIVVCLNSVNGYSSRHTPITLGNVHLQQIPAKQLTCVCVFVCLSVATIQPVNKWSRNWDMKVHRKCPHP